MIIKQFALVLFILSFICLNNGALVEFNYQYQTVVTKNWEDTSAWSSGVVPTSNDDVYIGGGDYSSNGINTLVINSPATVRSLYYRGNDLRVICASTLTTGNFTIGGLGNFSGTTASSALILTGIALLDFTSTGVSADRSVLSNIVVNATQTANVKWLASAYTTGLTINSYGTWKAVAASFDDDSTSKHTFFFNNYGTLQASSGYYESTTIKGGLTHYQGNIIVDSGHELIVGPYSDSPNANFFTCNAAVNIIGKLTVTDSSRGTFNQGCTLSGTGIIYALGYDDYAPLIFNAQSISFPGTIYLEGATQVSGNSIINVSSLTWAAGGKILGSGLITVENLSMENKVYGSGGVTTLSGRNITVTKNLYIGTPSAYFGQGSFLVVAPTVTTGIINYGIFYQVAKDTTTVGIVNYGIIQAKTDVMAYWQCWLPFHNYGTIYVPNVGYPGFVQPSGLYLSGGGNQYYSIGSFELEEQNDFYAGGQSNVYMELDGYHIIQSTASFHGGMIEFGNANDCTDYLLISCYLPGLTQWLGRTNTIGDGVILSEQATTFSIDGPGVIIERMVVVGNQVTGKYNLTIVQMRRVSFGYNADWIINATSVIITSNLTLEYNDITFIKHGKLVINPGATFFIPNGIYSETITDSDAGTYNYGTSIFDITQNSYDYLESSLFNYATIQLNTKVVTNTMAKGGAIIVKGKLWQSPTAVLKLNVYDNGDADKLSFYPGTACAYTGILEYTFQYTPSENDVYEMGRTQWGNAPTCTGTFTIRTVNLPAELQAIIVYDYPRNDGTQEVINYLVICSASNSTCSNYKRTATSTTATTGIETTTGMEATTGVEGTTATATGATAATAATASTSTTGKQPDNSHDSTSSGNIIQHNAGYLLIAIMFVNVICLLL